MNVASFKPYRGKYMEKSRSKSFYRSLLADIILLAIMGSLLGCREPVRDNGMLSSNANAIADNLHSSPDVMAAHSNEQNSHSLLKMESLISSFQELTNAFHKYAGKELTSQEEQTLFYQLQSLGLVAQTND